MGIDEILTNEKIHNAIDSLPDNPTIEQVIDQIILLDKIEKGLMNVEEGRFFSTEEVKARLSLSTKKSI